MHMALIAFFQIVRMEFLITCNLLVMARHLIR